MKEKLVIVPTYNEAENIEELVGVVMALDYPFDMLVVDDDSPDGTAQLVEALQDEMVQPIKNRIRLRNPMH
ncbi:MAG: glycosyltransferase, partial [Flavobacteriaceae bacterium]